MGLRVEDVHIGEKANEDMGGKAWGFISLNGAAKLAQKLQCLQCASPAGCFMPSCANELSALTSWQEGFFCASSCTVAFANSICVAA